jgi:hypothetical protein
MHTQQLFAAGCRELQAARAASLRSPDRELLAATKVFSIDQFVDFCAAMLNVIGVLTFDTVPGLNLHRCKASTTH